MATFFSLYGRGLLAPIASPLILPSLGLIVGVVLVCVTHKAVPAAYRLYVIGGVFVAVSTLALVLFRLPGTLAAVAAAGIGLWLSGVPAVFALLAPLCERLCADGANGERITALVIARLICILCGVGTGYLAVVGVRAAAYEGRDYQAILEVLALLLAIAGLALLRHSAEPASTGTTGTAEDAASIEQAAARLASSFSLTPREREVLILLAKGFSVPACAQRLGVSSRTAETHAKHIYKKLGVHDRTALLELVEASAQGTAAAHTSDS